MCTNIIFFQAEDGIRDGHVTGVQTCALPICSASLESSIEATEKLEPDMIDDVWPPFTYDEDEIDVLMDSEVDLHKTVEEMRAKLIVGQASFDEWDEYIETLNDIGLEDYMKAQQSAYERYKE